MQAGGKSISESVNQRWTDAMWYEWHSEVAAISHGIVLYVCVCAGITCVVENVRKNTHTNTYKHAHIYTHIYTGTLTNMYMKIYVYFSMPDLRQLLLYLVRADACIIFEFNFNDFHELVSLI